MLIYQYESNVRIIVCYAHDGIPKCVQIACKNGLNFPVIACSARIYCINENHSLSEWFKKAYGDLF